MQRLEVKIEGQPALGPDFTVRTQPLQEQPPKGVGSPGLKNALFCDVFVQGVPKGHFAKVSISSDTVSANTKMQYWFQGRWADAAEQSVSAQDKTITGKIPVECLNGTPIVIGTW